VNQLVAAALGDHEFKKQGALVALEFKSNPPARGETPVGGRPCLCAS
jgi:hypothetical protein